ncbi:Uncharacterized protein GBIM_07344 [Gryllus bimaculatus]|nr:Uncharacterized protein GBIM_07344 [Gryllus bimaculatus]
MSTWLLPLEALPAPSTGAAVLVALLVGAAGALYAYVTRHFDYWRRRGVPFLRPLPVAGNLKDVLLFRKHVGDVLHEVYTQMKEEPYLGLFFYDVPVFFIKDAELFKEILTNDFEYFQDRGFSPDKDDLIFSESLFARKGQDNLVFCIPGDRWKDLRLKLHPAFPVTKLKRFYDLIEQKASNLDHYFDEAAEKGEPCDVSNACARYTMDAVATVGFGIETTALTNDDDPLHRVLRTTFVYSKLYLLALLRLLRLSLVPAPLADFLRRTVWAAARERERTGTLGARRDMLDLLLELRDKGRIAADEDTADGGDSGRRIADDGNGPIVENDSTESGEEAGSSVSDMDGDVLIAQAFTMFTAGFETTSATMSFALYHLAKEQVIQDKLRNILQEVVQNNEGKLSYDALQSVKYLDMIFSGFKLAYLQGKLGLAHLVLNYKFWPYAATPSKMEYNIHSFMLSPRNGVPLMFSRVEK